MPLVTTKEMGIFAAKQFREALSEPSSSNVYLTIGRVRPWNNEAAPDVPITSVFGYTEIWQNMIGGKRLTTNDMKHVIPRFEWTANTVYYAYDDKTQSEVLKSSNTQFYVVTDEYNVYKCLANNHGANSSTKPTSTITTGDFQTSDGYIWKYMYTISDESKLRFTNENFIPVSTLVLNDGSLQWQVQENALEGALHSMIITNPGSGYTANDVFITIVGDGQDANAYAVINTSSNTIQSIVVDNKGTGYTNAQIGIYSSLGSGAQGRVIISPWNGHGSDPVTELGGSYLMINPRLKNTEGDKLVVNNDYRQITLLEDPVDYISSNISSQSTFSQLKVLTVTGISAEYMEDEYAYQGNSFDSATFKGVVVEWDSANSIVKLSNTIGTPTSDLLIGQTSSASRFVSFVQNQDLVPYTGKILYIDNILPIERAIDQTEDFKIILNF